MKKIIKITILLSLFLVANNVSGKTLVSKYYCIANDLVGIEHFPKKRSGKYALDNTNNHFTVRIFKEGNEYFLESSLATNIWLSYPIQSSESLYGPWLAPNSHGGYFKLFPTKNGLRFILLMEELGKGSNKNWSYANNYLYDGICNKS